MPTTSPKAISRTDKIPLQAALQASVTAMVKRQYEQHPYPFYPLWQRPKWQEGYAGSLQFVNRVVEKPDNFFPHILVAGCGDSAPLIHQKWNRVAKLTCVDLSKRAINRARLRLHGTPGRRLLIANNLEAHLQLTNDVYDHVDLYGVLHHLADPQEILRRLHGRLAPDGTIRVMIYNSDSRRFIHHIQRAFVGLKLFPWSRSDIALARKYLRHLANVAPGFAESYKRMDVASNSRFVDTFMHTREIRRDINWWISCFHTNGYLCRALLDRYGELDDLANPLWHMPTGDQLRERSKDRRFEGNLELILTKHDCAPTDKTATGKVKKSLRFPPKSWFDFPETKATPLPTRMMIWKKFLSRGSTFLPAELTELVHRNDGRQYDGRQNDRALARLCRLGAISKEQLPQEYHSVAVAPLETTMDPPQQKAAKPLDNTPLAAWIDRDLHNRGLTPQKKRIILERFYRAQF